MQLTIVKADNLVIKDGRAIFMDLGPFKLPDDFWALQWNEDRGEVEDTDPHSPNEKIETLDDYLPIVQEFDRRAGEEDKPEPPLSPEDTAAMALQTINNMADAILQPITSTYPNIEIISWDKQEIEARRWQEWQDGDKTEPEPPTSYIDNILLTRKDVDKPELIRRIIYKADTFSQSGQVTGIRQTLEKQIEAILADDTMTDDQKREAINAIDARAAFSVVTL